MAELFEIVEEWLHYLGWMKNGFSDRNASRMTFLFEVDEDGFHYLIWMKNGYNILV